MVRGSMKSVRSPALGRINRIGDQGIAWRTSNALPRAIRQSDGQHLADALAQTDQWSDERSNTVASQHQWLSPRQPV
jgi:hypothetical protein